MDPCLLTHEIFLQVDVFDVHAFDVDFPTREVYVDWLPIRESNGDHRELAFEVELAAFGGF